MKRNHKSDTAPMLASPRGGARTRDGHPCRSPVVRGKNRCRMHGGAPGSGAPRKNKNALKSGFYIREEIEQRRRTKNLIRQWREFHSEISAIDEALNTPLKDETDDWNYPD